MHDELHQFQRNNVWTLVPRSEGVNIRGIKWISCNKTNEEGNFIRNKAILIVQGYTQVEGVDFDQMFALVARIESIRVLLALAYSVGVCIDPLFLLYFICVCDLEWKQIMVFGVFVKE